MSIDSSASAAQDPAADPAAGVLADAELIAAAQGGDQAAFRDLYRRYARPVYLVALGVVSVPHDAEEVVQEAFLTAWRKLPGLQLASPSALPWLATITRFTARNALRTRMRRAEVPLPDTDPQLRATDDGPEEAAIRAQATARLEAAIGALSPVERSLFELCVRDGISYAEAARRLGLTHGGVRNRLSRLRIRLRAALARTEA